MDVRNFNPEFSVTGVLWSAASVICDGNFRSFLPQCREKSVKYYVRKRENLSFLFLVDFVVGCLLSEECVRI